MNVKGEIPLIISVFDAVVFHSFRVIFPLTTGATTTMGTYIKSETSL